MGWKEVRFGDLYLEPSRNGLTRPRSSRGSGFKMINMGEIFGHDRIGCISMERVQLSHAEIERFSVRPLDLMFARQSMVAEGAGKCSLVTAVDEVTCFESHLIRVRLDQREADPEFFYLYFKSRLGRSKIEAIVTGAAQKGIRGSELQELTVDCPPLESQRRIASILSAYDDLIENNTRRIAILEEMARRIYEEWFVRFRFPGYEQVKMVESELGSIPEGWSWGSLRDVAEDVRESVHPEAIAPDTPYVGLEHIPRRSIALTEWGFASEVQSTKLRFVRGDILFGKIRPYFHKVAVAPVDGVASSDAIVIRARESKWYPLVLATVSSDAFVAEATQSANGTKMPRANWNVLLGYKLPKPTDEVLAKFNEIMLGVVDFVRVALLKNRNLRATRDLLLPKLISGELDVSTLPEPEAA